MSKVFVDMINTRIPDFIMGAYTTSLDRKQLAHKIALEAPLLLKSFNGGNTIVITKSTYQNFVFVVIDEKNVKKEG